MTQLGKVVDLVVKDGIAAVTINRPEALNALNQAVVEQLGEAVDRAVASAEVKAVVLAGAGKAFVAGADIKFFVDNIEAGTIPAIARFTRRGQEVLRQIERSPKPVVAKVDGLSLGGGTELALACHAIVVTENGSFGFPETGIGIYPGLGGTQRTARILGAELAKYLVLTGASLDAPTAHELGLAGYLAPAAEVDAFIRNLLAAGPLADKFAPKPVPERWRPVVEAFSAGRVGGLLAGGGAADPDPAVQKAAKALTRKAPIALRLANQLVDEGLRRDLDAGLELELAHLGEIFASKDALVGLKSVLERSKPEFTGT